ncbi:MAG TPA: lipase [Corynebacterium nuruki]|uniref:Lipase n=1 Tax=Corynebacterium nuruki TaxID=1032851 RepID=A0A3D4SXZ9_9CORY|nr:lipase [Corynebacterium nuruki]
MQEKSTKDRTGRTGTTYRTLVATVAALGIGAATWAPTAGAAASSNAVHGQAGRVEIENHDPFYDTDDLAGVLPGAAPGQVLRTTTAPYTPNLAGLDAGLLAAAPSTVQKIMYNSVDEWGENTPVSGYVVEPNAPWRGAGERPTVVIGRGTVGQGDQCAPSRNWPLDNQPDPVSSGRAVALEGLYDLIWASQGVRVVVTDYVGMGTPGMHTYMNKLDQAHAELDAARTARSMVEDAGGAFGKVAFYGHSQGGGAAAASAEQAASYAPDLDVAGVYASAPPAELGAVQRNIDGSDLVGAIGYTINGLRARYPELQPLLDENLSDRGRETLDAISGQCTDEITDNFGHQTTSEWTKDGRSLDALLSDMPEAQRAMEDQHIGAPGNPLPTVPVMIISGRYDQNVEYNQAKDLAEHWSQEGVPVTYRNDIMPPLADYNHFVQAISGGPFGISFLLDRFNGVPYGEGITDSWA